MVERRKFKRLDTTKIEVKWKRTALTPSVAHTKNISAGGICLMLENNDILNEGDLLDLEFKLSNGKQVLAKGRVVWSEEIEIIGQNEKRKEVGIEFVEIDDGTRECISQFVFSILNNSERPK